MGHREDDDEDIDTHPYAKPKIKSASQAKTGRRVAAVSGVTTLEDATLTLVQSAQADLRVELHHLHDTFTRLEESLKMYLPQSYFNETGENDSDSDKKEEAVPASEILADYHIKTSRARTLLKRMNRLLDNIVN